MISLYGCEHSLGSLLEQEKKASQLAMSRSNTDNLWIFLLYERLASDAWVSLVSTQLF